VTICVLSCLVLTNGCHQWLSGGDKKQKQKKRLTEVMTGHQSAGMLLLLPIEMKNPSRRVCVVSLGFGCLTADCVIQIRCNDPVLLIDAVSSSAADLKLKIFRGRFSKI
jgi:hypothetical protein